MNDYRYMCVHESNSNARHIWSRWGGVRSTLFGGFWIEARCRSVLCCMINRNITDTVEEAVKVHFWQIQKLSSIKGRYFIIFTTGSSVDCWPKLQYMFSVILGDNVRANGKITHSPTQGFLRASFPSPEPASTNTRTWLPSYFFSIWLIHSASSDLYGRVILLRLSVCWAAFQ